jgi:hypothetical protein
MNYNPIKLQNDLRLIPTATLIQYVQGMNPEVPSYMALGVLKERKEMEAKYEAENQKTPESSVAEDLTQGPQGGLQMLAGNPMGNQAQPNPAPQGAPTMPADQGVASLDTGDMFNEKNFAGGVIVAFDDGGEVDYAGGGMVAFDKGGKVPSFAGPGGSYINPEMAYNDPALMAQYQEYLKANPIYVRNPQAGLRAFLSDISKTSEIMRTPLSPSFLSQVGLAGLKTGESAMAGTAQKARERYFGEQPTISSAATTIPGAEILGSTAAADRLSNPMYSTDYARAADTVARKQVPPSTGEVLAQDVTKPAAGPAPTPREAGIESLLEDTDGLAEKRMARYKQMVGEDPERARLEELTRKYETGAAEQERMAPWMALAKAGFSMAGGKSPFAIQNISEGAQAGLADYVQARDKLDKLTEKQIDIRTKMQQARRAEDIAATTYGLNSEAAVEARNAQVKLKDMEEKNTFARTKYAADVSTKNAMIAAAKKSDYETFMDLAKQDDDNYKTVKDKDGTVRKVFDASKVTQTWKSFSGSSGLDDDKLFAAYQQEKMMDKNFNLSFQEYRDRIRGTSGGAAPTTNRPPLGNIFNTK